MKKWKLPMMLLLAVTLILSVIAGCSSSSGGSKSKDKEDVKITALIDNTADQIALFEALIKKFQETYPYVKFEYETRPGGTEGDNIVKTRLATGDMSDIFFYNSGSLLQAINPDQNLYDLSKEPFMDKVMDSFKSVVSTDKGVYGIPGSATSAGGWFYNKKIYEQHGLKPPTTWSELMANMKALEGTDVSPIIGSYKDTWSSQLIVLADYYNVFVKVPNFAEEYTNNKAKYATTPAALRSFEKLEETVGLYNKDFLATTYDEALRMLSEGEGAHYPMLTFAISALQQNYPDTLNDIGFFAQPGESASDNGLTVWMPNAFYVNKNAKNMEEVLLFMAFVASPEGASVMATLASPTGPYVIEGAQFPENVPQVVKDMLPYFDSGKNTAALEFVSPVKGPSLEQITVEVGSGQRKAADAAVIYDEDVKKQAQQLGLEGW